MRILRKIIRLFAILIWSLYAVLSSLTASFRKNKWDAIAAMTEKVNFWCKGIMKICNIRLHIHGNTETAKGVLIVSNHCGYVDILTHAATFPIRFAPKAELKNAILFGPITALSHPVWVNRKNKMQSGKCVAEFMETLEHKISLLVYPEGTTGDNTTLLPFKTGPFEVAIQGAYPVLPILTFYSVDKGEAEPGWFDNSEMTTHIWKFLGIKEITAHLYILPVLHPGSMDRKEFSIHVREEMLKAHTKILQEQKTNIKI